MNTFYGGNPPASSIGDHKFTKSLGIFTKSDSTLAQQGFQRIKNFLLQDQSAKLLPKERVCNCLKKRIDKTRLREVKYNEERQKAHWSNVQRCGSLWTCPVCAKQITEKRREELAKCVKLWRSLGGDVLLLTLTNSHSASHNLKALIKGQLSALKRFFGGRKGQYLFARLGRKFHIRAFEVTHGQNGWHPHFHILLFVDGSPVSYELKTELSKHWINACKLSGLPLPSMTYGLDLRDGKHADKYVSKWGIEHEMTKGHVKKGRKDSHTPFDLLELSLEDNEVHGKKPSKLFQEYAIAFKGMRQLVWSRGLREALDIEEKTDEELAEETEHNAITLTTVEDLFFGLLCKYQKRAEFLIALEDDYNNGCFGSGSAERLKENLVNLEIRNIENAH